MDISVFISDLLFEHDCVIVPGFGGFICNYRAAEIHPVLHIISPPSKAISFNVNLSSNDGLLISYIAKTGDLSFTAAQSLVSTWVEATKSLLRQKETVVLKRIGRVFSDIEGNLQFVPDESVNYLKASYALKPIAVKPVLRGKEIDFTEKFAHETKKRDIKPSRVWKIAAMIILVAGIAGLIQMMRMGVEVKPLGFNEAGFFSFFTHFTGNHEDSMQPVAIETVKPVVVEQPKTDTVAVEPAKTEPVITAPVKTENETVIAAAAKTNPASQHSYYIIIGAFSSDKNAENAKAELQKKFPNSDVIGEKAGRLIRVGYSVGSNEQTAQQELNTAHLENPASWLMKK
jgi:cell division septation protein DedD